MASNNDFRIAGALGIDPDPSNSSEEEVMTQGLGFPLRPISSVPPLEVDLPEGIVALGQPMQWMGLWQEGMIYPAGSYVRDNVYAAVANTLTTDKPSPVPTGNPEWSQPSFTPVAALVAGVARSGQEYAFNASGNGWLNGVRVWFPTTGSEIIHRVYVLNTTDPARPKTLYQTEVFGLAGQWVPIGNLYMPIITGQKITVLLETVSSFSEQTYSYNYRYDGVATTAPATGGWNRESDQKTIRVSKTDADGVDRSTQLGQANIGSTFTFTDQGDGSKTYTYRVESNTEDTDSYTYGVVLTSGVNEPTVGNLCYTNVKVVSLSDAEISEDENTWLTQPSWAAVTGLLYSNNVLVPSNELNGFGVDLQFEPATYSTDWTLVSAAPF